MGGLDRQRSVGLVSGYIFRTWQCEELGGLWMEVGRTEAERPGRTGHRSGTEHYVFTDCGMSEYSVTRRVTGAAEGRGQRVALSWGATAGLSHVSSFASLLPWEIL